MEGELKSTWGMENLEEQERERENDIGREKDRDTYIEGHKYREIVHGAL